MTYSLLWIDEAWRWPWCGPVVACCLCFDAENMPEKDFLAQIRDSKKLTHIKREKIFEQLITMGRFWEEKQKPQVIFWIWVVDNYVIDEKNIKQANKEAMRRALEETLRKIKYFSSSKKHTVEVYIDGNDNYTFEILQKQPTFVVGGDDKILEISAASIIAKVLRDKLMDVYDSVYPDLGIVNHKGYGTKKHIIALKNSACVTGIHRLSFQPIKRVLGENLYDEYINATDDLKENIDMLSPDTKEKKLFLKELDRILRK